MMTIPPGASEEAFKRALRDLSKVVGQEWVFYKDEDIARYSDSFWPCVAEPEQQRVASAAVAPTEAGQVQQLERIANQ